MINNDERSVGGRQKSEKKMQQHELFSKRYQLRNSVCVNITV